jgi:hypothetical protein
MVHHFATDKYLRAKASGQEETPLNNLCFSSDRLIVQHDEFHHLESSMFVVLQDKGDTHVRVLAKRRALFPLHRTSLLRREDSRTRIRDGSL